ncbi:MAG: RagB/SusD family nutrient uptake outer membrane protein [Bacteroidota bacterium]|nr:RagB/SusD family nutrient uptake outer membrane protein [Bacteroidota bacterium]
MKKLSIIVATCLLTAMSYSCADSFLDKKPLGSTSEDVFYSEKGVNALLTGAYSMVKGSALWTVSWGASITNWTYGSVASDDGAKGSYVGDQIPINEIERWEVSTTNNYPADKWVLNIGMGVNRCNIVLNVIAKTPELAAATASEFKAEARFLRGLYYFESWLVFGDKIPLISEDKVDVANTITNENAAGAVLKFIIDDLKFAADNLPAKQAQVGRATKWAAKALAARAYLQVLDYASAKPLLDEIINSGQFSLATNFFDNFRIAKNNNIEGIFEIQRNVNDINESLNGEMGIGLNAPYAPELGMCCGFHQPTQNLANAFKVDAAGLPLFDTFNNTDLKNDQGIASTDEFIPATDLLDPRIDFTMGRRGLPYMDWGIMRGMDWIRDQSWGGPYVTVEKTFFYKKERNTLSTTTGWQTGINANNFRYLRFGHILLWRAEVAAFEGDLGTALKYVNQIRVRAGKEVVMGKVNLYKLPVSVNTGDDWKQYVDFTVPAANYKVGTYAAFADKNMAMKAVQWEQRLEFATEGMRFFDLRRWDKLPAGQRVDMKATLEAFAAADKRIRPDVMKGATFEEKDKYQPIPQTQLDLQPGVLSQNAGY